MTRYAHQGTGPIATQIGDDLAELATDARKFADRAHHHPDVSSRLACDAHLCTMLVDNLAQSPDGLQPHAPKQFLEDTRDRLDDLARAFARSDHAVLAGEATRLRDVADDLSGHGDVEVRA